MTNFREDLRRRFRNGKLPDENDFADLIDAYALQKDFDSHLKAFLEFETRRSITLGDAESGWNLAVDENGRVRLAPARAADDPVLADVRLHGWVGAAGRVGAVSDPKAFVDPTPELAARGLLSTPSDGEWRTIVEAPGRPCIVEIAAAIRPSQAKPPGFWGKLARRLGYRPAGAAVMRAVAASNAAGAEPTISATGSPSVAEAWRPVRRTALVLFLALFCLSAANGALDLRQAYDDFARFVAEAVSGVEALETGAPETSSAPEAAGGPAASSGGTFVARVETEAKADVTAGTGALSMITWPIALTGLVLLFLLGTLAYLLNRLVRLFFISRSVISLRWNKAGGGAPAGTAKYELQLRGPDLPSLGEAPVVHYHITKIWS